MTNFDKAYRSTMQNEGGWVNNPNDKGRETYKGIARGFWPQWKGWPIIDEIKNRVGVTANAINREASLDPILDGLVKDFYRVNFWNPIRLGDIKYASISEELFDTSVNMGVGVAAKMLQEALNLCNKNGKSYPDIVVDGIIGPITLSTLNNKANERVIFNTLNLLQGERYLNIMRSNKSQKIFWEGWLKRVLLK